MAQPKHIPKREWNLRCEADMFALKYHFASGLYDMQILYNEPLKNEKIQEHNDWGVWRLCKNLQDKRYSLQEILDILIYNKFQ